LTPLGGHSVNPAVLCHLRDGQPGRKRAPYGHGSRNLSRHLAHIGATAFLWLAAGLADQLAALTRCRRLHRHSLHVRFPCPVGTLGALLRRQYPSGSTSRSNRSNAAFLAAQVRAALSGVLAQDSYAPIRPRMLRIFAVSSAAATGERLRAAGKQHMNSRLTRGWLWVRSGIRAKPRIAHVDALSALTRRSRNG
jgi:hypothetical protein